MGLFIAARHLGKSPEEASSFTQADLASLDAPTRALVMEELRISP